MLDKARIGFKNHFIGNFVFIFSVVFICVIVFFYFKDMCISIVFFFLLVLQDSLFKIDLFLSLNRFSDILLLK